VGGWVCSPAQRTGRARVAALRRRQQHHVPAPPWRITPPGFIYINNREEAHMRRY
jgi:hypothetical protein